MFTPAVAAANFVWPPALYYYSFTHWWIVVVGLAVEAAVYAINLRLPIWKAVGVSVLTNLVSAGVGFVVTWPVVFYGSGIELAIRTLGGTSLVGVVGLIFALNVVVEYWVAVGSRLLPRSRKVLWNVVLANILSFMFIVVSIPTWFRTR